MSSTRIVSYIHSLVACSSPVSGRRNAWPDPGGPSLRSMPRPTSSTFRFGRTWSSTYRSVTRRGRPLMRDVQRSWRSTRTMAKRSSISLAVSASRISFASATDWPLSSRQTGQVEKRTVMGAKTTCLESAWIRRNRDQKEESYREAESLNELPGGFRAPTLTSCMASIQWTTDEIHRDLWKIVGQQTRESKRY